MGVQEETMSNSLSGSLSAYRQGAEGQSRGDQRGHPRVDSGTKRARSGPPEPWTRGSRVPCDGGQYSLQEGVEEEEEEEEVKGRASMRRRVSSSSELRYPKLNLSVTAIFLLSVPTAPRHHNSVGGRQRRICRSAKWPNA